MMRSIGSSCEETMMRDDPLPPLKGVRNPCAALVSGALGPLVGNPRPRGHCNRHGGSNGGVDVRVGSLALHHREARILDCPGTPTAASGAGWHMPPATDV